MVRRTRGNKRSRKRRDRGKGGASLPSRTRQQDKEHEWGRADIKALREIHSTRTKQAQVTDEALLAPIAPSPGHWIQDPDRYDVHGVDYPEHETPRDKRDLRPHERQQRAREKTGKKAKPKPKKIKPKAKKKKRKPGKPNPYSTPATAKKHIQPILEKYRKKLGVESEIKLSARNRGYPAQIIHHSDEQEPIVRFNYDLYGKLYDKSPKLTERYMEYAVAHELAHRKQKEILGFKGIQRAMNQAEAEVEEDADRRAVKALGLSMKQLDNLVEKLAEETGTIHERRTMFKGEPDLARFKDKTPGKPSKRSKAETRKEMAKRYRAVLGELIPTATNRELEHLSDKAIEEEWIKPDTRYTPELQRNIETRAKQELLKHRQKQAEHEREAKLKAVKERGNQIKQRREDIKNAILDLVEQDAGLSRDSMETKVADYLNIQEIRDVFKTRVATIYDQLKREGRLAKPVDGSRYVDLLRDARNQADLDNLMAELNQDQSITQSEKYDIAAMVEQRREILPTQAKPVKKEKYSLYVDPGHAWLRVPVKKLEELGIKEDITASSHRKGRYAYLEEDVDARRFIDALKKEGVEVEILEHFSESRSSIRGYQPYKKPEKASQPRWRQWDKVPVEALGTVPGIGSQVIDGLVEQGYDTVGQVYRKADSSHGGLMTVTGIGRKTNQTLPEQIEKHIPTNMEYKPEPVIDIPEKKPGKPVTPEDTHIDSIIRQIQAEKPQLTDEAIHELIKNERAKSANLLTREAAAILAADNLGVALRERKHLPSRDLARHNEKLRDGTHRVDVWNPRKNKWVTEKNFNTEAEADAYVKRVNLNPGWPDTFYETPSGTKTAPEYIVIAENTKQRGSESVKYQVYEKLPKSKKKEADYQWYPEDNGKPAPYRLKNRGTREYGKSGVPDKNRLIEDLTRDIEKDKTEIQFRQHPHWAPMVGKIERITPSPSNTYQAGKWRVYIVAKEGGKVVGEKWFDTPEEAIRYANKGRGETKTRGIQRESVWQPLPPKPDLPEELEKEFQGKKGTDRFQVDKHPRYSDRWDPDSKKIVHGWYFENKDDDKLYTVDELKEAYQRGEWRRRDREKAAKGNRVLERKKGARTKPFYRKAKPIRSAVYHPEAARMEAQGDKVTYMGMDPSHVSMIKLVMPNELEIPDGRYEAAEDKLDKRVTVYNSPTRVEWDNVERRLSVSNTKMDQESSLRYEKVHSYEQDLPDPRVHYQAEAMIDLGDLSRDLNKLDKLGVEHVTFRARDGKLVYETPPESDGTVKGTGDAGEIKNLSEEDVEATYTLRYVNDHLDLLRQSGFNKASLEYASDMPLKLTGKSGEATAEIWLAPCIGV